MKRALISLLAIVGLLQPAFAAPRTVLVLRTEGTADANTRTAIDGAIVKLAKNLDGKVDAGDITLTDAAAAVGCNPADASCKDEVLATLGVDEMIATTATSTPMGTNVTVRRLTKGAPPKAQQATVATGRQIDPSLTADLGPLFGLAAAQPPPPVPPVPEQQPPPPPVSTTPPPPQQQPDMTPINTTPTVTAAPMGQVAPTNEGEHKSYRWQKIGMGAGATLVVLSFLMWSGASDRQEQIDNAPTPRTPADFENLRQLEKEGDDLAGGGNLFFLTGVVVGGISAYSYWKGHRAQRQATQAVITPTVYPQGAGVMLTIGGAR